MHNVIIYIPGVEKNSSTRSQFTNENNLNYEQAPEKKSQFTFKSSSNIIETKKTENHSKSEDVFNLCDENETEIIGKFIFGTQTSYFDKSTCSNFSFYLFYFVKPYF